MSYKFIIGPSGAGKTEKILDLALKAGEDRNNTIKIIVPDQYTLETQKRIIEKSLQKGILNIDVVSFNRLAIKVFKKVGGSRLSILDELAKSLIIKKLMTDNKSDLKYFKDLLNVRGISLEVKSLISELMQYGVGYVELSEVISGLDDIRDKRFKDKLTDTALIYKAFQDKITGSHLPPETLVLALRDRLKETDFLRESILYFDGFTGFTPLQYQLIEVMMSQAAETVFSAAADVSDKGLDKTTSDFFFMTEEMIKKIEGIAKKVKIKRDEDIFLKIPVRYKERPELIFLEKNFLRRNNEYKDDVTNIHLTEANDLNEELKAVTGKIYDLTRNKGYRYKDIAIITGDIETFGRRCVKFLNQNGVECFLDAERDLSGNNFTSYVKFLFKAVKGDFTPENIFGLIKTGLTSLGDDPYIYYLENYCIALGIKNEGLWKTKWDRKSRRERQTDKEIYNLDKLNDLRKRLVDEVLLLRKAVKKATNAGEAAECVKEFFVKTDFNARLKNKVEDLGAGEENLQLMDKVNDILDKIKIFLGDEVLSTDDFFTVFESGLDAVKIGLIPKSLDSVIIGDIERTRLDKIKVLFVLGLNDGLIPQPAKEAGLLTEGERRRLVDKGIELAPSAGRNALIKRFYMYLVFTKPSDELYLSYSGRDLEGGAISPSYLVREVRNIFPGLKLKKLSAAQSQENVIIPEAKDVAPPVSDRFLDKNITKDLFGEEIKGSASRFEIYNSCKYRFFMEYGLSLRKREEYEVTDADFGTIVHDILYRAVSFIKDSKKVSEKEVIDRFRGKMSDEILEAYGVDLTTADGNFIKRNIDKLLEVNLKAIIRQIYESDFRPLFLEKEFSLNLPLKEERSILLRGRIDRIDVAKKDGDRFFRIIDYKTGEREVDLTKIYDGRDIQLFAYLLGLAPDYLSKKTTTAGLFYYNVKNPIIAVEPEKDKEITLDDIDKNIMSDLRLVGIFNSDEDVIKILDKTQRFPLIKGISKGKPARGGIGFLSKDFEAAAEFERKKLIETGENIIRGDISAAPSFDKNRAVCDWCIYKEACGFSKDMPKNTFKRPKGLSKDDIREILACLKQ